MECECKEQLNTCESIKDKTRNEMLEEIKSLNFAIIELGLYLDTHRRRL